MLKVIKMLLIHDLVEIYSGDYIVFTENTLEKENKEKIGRCFEKSLKSAILIFIILGIAFISYTVSEYITGIFF